MLVGRRVLPWVLTLALGACASSRAEDRVANARKARGEDVRRLFLDKGLAWPPGEIFLRAFKEEGILELWAGPRGGALTLVKTFDVCMRSGDLGPKRQLGDGQVPEGFYVVDRFNPRSNFHLSLGLDYPNASDRIRGVKGRLGGNIFIHGNCVTIGCLPLRDGPMEELYLVALAARKAGQRRIHVHVFPTRLDPVGLARLKREEEPEPALWRFWQELAPGYQAFERTRRPPRVTVDPGTGAYRVKARAPAKRSGTGRPSGM